ncbi:MAG: hypothetical protein JST84_07905 [Acidobacteria bacterium]|nr:hypothetical protein [Acidobacteriota bacterium]
MNVVDVKEETRRLLNRLPDNLTWQELMDEIIIREAIEAGLRDSEAGRVKEIDEVRANFGLQP